MRGTTLRGLVRRAAGAALGALIACLAAAPALAASVTLQWDANTEPDLAGYKLHYGVASGAYTTHLDVANVVTRTVTGLGDGTKYFFAVTAYDSVGNESGYSNEVSVTTAAASVETVTAPQAPTGPTSGVVGVAYTYTAAGAAASTGDAVQYRFSWADGTDSGWLAAGVTSAQKTWSAAGTYTLVRVEARCASHTSVVSQPSASISVAIAAAAVETVSAPTRPSGPTSGVVGAAYTYTTGGSSSSAGDPVEYRFSWSDGSTSAWLPAGSASATKTWATAGTYTLVRAEARCSRHPTIVSSASSALTVVITPGAAETVSAPSAPAGPTSGSVGTLYSFTSGGAVSSAGDPVKYRFHWGDGTASDWIEPGQPVTASKAWSVAGAYRVETEASCATHATVAAISAAVDVTIAEAAPVAYALWSRSDTGQAALWRLDRDTNELQAIVSPYRASGVGAPWLATDYAPIDGTTGYLLWSRSDTGQAQLWKIDSTDGSLLGSAWLRSSAGVGTAWEATSYVHVNDTTGYVLWTRADTGQAVLWEVDPSATEAIKARQVRYLGPQAGVGKPWRATSYVQVSDTSARVLWTRSDTGQGILWDVDTSGGGKTIPVVKLRHLRSSAGIGKPWQATGYVQVDATTAQVLWTRSDTGQGVLWNVDPTVEGNIVALKLHSLHSKAGVGGPWQATGYAR